MKTLQTRLKPAVTIKNHPGAWTAGALILLGIITGLLSMLLGASYLGWPMFASYFASPLLLLLNLLPPVLITLLVYFASGRAWPAFLAAALVVLGFSAVNYFKIQVRNEPFVPSDFALIEEAGDAVAGYTFTIGWSVWLSAAFIAAGAVLSVLFLRHKPQARTRLIGAGAALALAAAAVPLYFSDAVYPVARGGYPTGSDSKTEAAIARGFVYPFIRSLCESIKEKPGRDEMEEAMAQLELYGDDVIPEDKKVDIVSVMLESYCDLSKFGALEFTTDVYKPLHDLLEESVSGSLIVNTFAGGTIDSERSFLTGFTELGDFMKPTNSYVRYLRRQGYYTEGFHAGDGWYYDRETINPNLGYENYYFLEDVPDSTRWDNFFFPEILSRYENRDKSRPYFAYHLSYQNHGPYSSDVYFTEPYIEQGDLSEAAYNMINNYLVGIDDTNRRLYEFVDYFRRLDTPVVLVVFGDHMPWLGDNNSVYNELGVNIDVSTDEGFYNYYSTPYFIWANDKAKQALGNDFAGDGGDFSPCFLMNKVFKLCSWGGNAYMKAANSLWEVTDIVNKPTGYFRENGRLTRQLSDEGAALYKRFKLIEYYWQYNFTFT